MAKKDQRALSTAPPSEDEGMEEEEPEVEPEAEEEEEEPDMEEEEEEEEEGGDAEDDDDAVDPTQELPDGAARGAKAVKKHPSKAVLGSVTGKTSIRKRLQLDLAPAAVRRRILQERFTPHTSQSTGVFMATALETFMRELIDTAVGVAQERKGTKPGKTKLTVQDIQKAVTSDEEFASIFQNVMFATHSVKAYEAPPKPTAAKKSSQSTS